MSLVDVEERDCLVGLGYLRFDDLGDLRVYSYTERCRYERAWNDITLNSRGIIFNRRTGECVAQPFPKFFLVGEVAGVVEESLPWDHVGHVFEKVDGFLGILYRHAGGFAITTRGCFTTPAAAWATAKLSGYHGLDALPDDVTLCFEIVHPMTHVLVDYGGTEALYLLGAFNRFTGEEYAWSRVESWGQQFGFPLPATYRAGLDILCKSIRTRPAEEFEGYVVLFESPDEPAFRVKIKGCDYLTQSQARSQLTFR